MSRRLQQLVPFALVAVALHAGVAFGINGNVGGAFMTIAYLTMLHMYVLERRDYDDAINLAARYIALLDIAIEKLEKEPQP